MTDKKTILGDILPKEQKPNGSLTDDAVGWNAYRQEALKISDEELIAKVLERVEVDEEEIEKQIKDLRYYNAYKKEWSYKINDGHIQVLSKIIAQNLPSILRRKE